MVSQEVVMGYGEVGAVNGPAMKLMGEIKNYGFDRLSKTGSRNVDLFSIVIGVGLGILGFISYIWIKNKQLKQIEQQKQITKQEQHVIRQPLTELQEQVDCMYQTMKSFMVRMGKLEEKMNSQIESQEFQNADLQHLKGRQRDIEQCVLGYKVSQDKMESSRENLRIDRKDSSRR